MKIFRLSITIFAVGLFLTACTSNQPQQTAAVDPYANNDETHPDADQNADWAKDNLDLQRVGSLLERSDNPQQFESLLNSDEGINNLDLNGDGYADYISVDEFDDRDGNERGLSIFSRFGPDLIQEIATIVLHRDDASWRGARVLLTGNEQLYGDNYYYETNWADRPVGVVTELFRDHDTYYRSPYYYDNYPADYRAYRIVETPVYRQRVERIYPAPVFVYTAGPSFKPAKIKSPHYGKWMDKVYARLAKPTREQAEFRKNNPRPPRDENGGNRGDRGDRDDRGDRGDKHDRGVKDDRDDRPGKKEDAPRVDDHHPKNERGMRGDDHGKPNKPEKSEKPNGKERKPESGGKGKGKGH